MMEVTPPRMNEMVEKRPLRVSSSLVRPSSGATELSRPKMVTLMMTMKTPVSVVGGPEGVRKEAGEGSGQHTT
jgi:hypothetical protein